MERGEMTKKPGYIERVRMIQPHDATFAGIATTYQAHFNKILPECSDQRLRDMKEVLQYVQSVCEELYIDINCELEGREFEIPSDGD